GPVVAVAGSQRQHAAGDRVARADGRTYRPPRRGAAEEDGRLCGAAAPGQRSGGRHVAGGPRVGQGEEGGRLPTGLHPAGRHRLLRRGFAAPSPPPTRRFRPKRICPLPPHVSPGLLSFHLSSSARRPSPKGHFADVHRGPPRRGRPSPRRHAQRHELRGATPYAHGGLSSTWGQPVLQRPRGRDAPALLSAPPSVRSAASLSQGFSLCRPCHPPSVGRWVRVRISLASGGAKFQSSLDSSCSAARLPLAGRPEVRGACKPRPMGASLFERGERGCEDFGPAPAAF
ncbi:unnamed protein product, partial [Prorocentrum cordatum]